MPKGQQEGYQGLGLVVAKIMTCYWIYMLFSKDSSGYLRFESLTPNPYPRVFWLCL